MAVPTNKDELLSAIDTSFDKLFTQLRDVPSSLVDEQCLDGHVKGTRMSVANLVAYLVGWNELVLKWIDRDSSGKPIDYPDTGYKGNELGKLAQKFYRDYEDVPYAELLDRLCLAKAKIVSFIENTDNAALYERPWYGKWTLGRMIQFNTSSPYANARGRLRKWVNTRELSQGA